MIGLLMTALGDLAVFCAAAAALLGAEPCPCTQPSLCLPQSTSQPARQSCVILETFMCLCAREGERGESKGE